MAVENAGWGAPKIHGELPKLGFEISELSGGSLAVAATPAVLSPAEREALLLRLATDSEASPDNLGEFLLADYIRNRKSRVR